MTPSAIFLWLLIVAALAMLLHRLTRHAAYMILVGCVLALFVQYDMPQVPEVHQTAMLLWAGAAVLLFSNFRALYRRRRSS